LQVTATRRPVIGISLIPRTIHARFGAYPGHSLSEVFVQAIADGGGIPIGLPVTRPEDAAVHAALLDGLVLAGGSDVEPERYGGTWHETMDWVDPRRDAWELALLDAADERGLPVLGVCRGCQLLNVHRGGTLHAHLDDELGHTSGGTDVAFRHHVRLEPATRTRAIVGEDAAAVTSLHHQAIDRVGSGLRATAYAAEDGGIEGVEDPERDVVGVAWHPEMQLAEPAGQSLFHWVVEAAAARLARAEVAAR
jgi:putative glutamine amidotransferase